MAKKATNINKRKFILLGFACGLIVLVLLFSTVSLAREKEERAQKALFATPTISQLAKDEFSYKGKTGKDALTLLKENARIEQDASGLVVSINGRKADPAKREYWAFYVNGNMAQVGPADYQTKDEDRVEWKIEKY